MILKENFKKVIIIAIPLFIVLLVIVCRYKVSPSNEEIINEVKNTKFYTADVEYTFKNAKTEFTETTKQYYSKENGGRIEFENNFQPTKVYKGNQFQVSENQKENKDIILDENAVYPIAFINNIFSNDIIGDIDTINAEWNNTKYLKINIQFNNKNKHLNKAEMYVDKEKKVPVLIKILDSEDKERIEIKYSNFKKEKNLDKDLF